MNTACLFFMASALWRMAWRDSEEKIHSWFSDALFYIGIWVLAFAFCDVINMVRGAGL